MQRLTDQAAPETLAPDQQTLRDQYDIRRAEAKNNIGFGYGIHFCLGAPLARLEAEVAFPLILGRFPELALADPDPPWSDSILTRGMLALKVCA